MSNLLINRFSKTKSVLSIKHKETGESFIDEKKYGWFDAKIHAFKSMFFQIFFKEKKSITIKNLDTAISYIHDHRYEILLNDKGDTIELKKDIEEVMKIFEHYLKTPEGNTTQKKLADVLLITNGRIKYLT